MFNVSLVFCLVPDMWFCIHFYLSDVINTDKDCSVKQDKTVTLTQTKTAVSNKLKLSHLTLTHWTHSLYIMKTSCSVYHWNNLLTA
jgi:hypothetical protein